MINRAKFFRPTSAAAAILILGLLTPFAQAQDYQGPGAIPDPGTYAGSRQIQEQEQQQDQQYRDQQQQQSEQGQQQSDQGQQYYGSGGAVRDPLSGPWGAMYLDPANPGATAKTSYNFASPAAARAAARGACYQAAGRPCTEALEYHYACAALAHSRNGPWAARAGGSASDARDQALLACEKAGGKECVVGHINCSPNND